MLSVCIILSSYSVGLINMNRHFPSPPVMKLFVFMGIVWAACVGPFLSILILKSFGATSSQLGIFSAFCAVITMVLQPVWGLISDKVRSPRRVLSFCLAVSTVFFSSLLLVKSLYIAAMLMIFDTIFRCGVVGLLDSHTLAEIKVTPGLQFSRIRMAASFSYGLLSLINSSAIHTWNVMAIIPISLGFALPAIFWGFFVAKGQWETSAIQTAALQTPVLQAAALQAGRNDPGVVPKAKPDLKKDIAILLRDKRYILLLAFVAFFALSVQPLFTFIIYYVTAVGGDYGHAPLIQGLRCVTELICFFFVSTLGKRLSSKTLMLAGICFSLVYIMGLLFANTLFWLIVFHLIGSPGYVLILNGRMQYVNEITPESVRSTSVTMMGACEIGLGSVIGNLIAGFVVGLYRTHVLTLVALAALFCAAAILAFIPGKGSKI